MRQAAIVALRRAVVHKGHRVGKRRRGLEAYDVDQEVAQVEALVDHLAIAVVERRVVEQLAEVLLYVHHASAAEAHHVAAFVELLYQFLAQRFGCAFVALVEQFLAAVGQRVGIEASDAEPFEQADGFVGALRRKLVDATGHKEPHFLDVCVHSSDRVGGGL